MSENDEKPTIEHEWMIRPCTVYKTEYKECTSVRGRFQQYFVFGETKDCTLFKHDYNDCTKWEKHKDVKAAQRVIDNETKRRMERLKAHYGNTVWKKRTESPPDWSKPLPQWMQERYEHTYLNLKAKEMKENPERPLYVPEEKSCVIL